MAYIHIADDDPLLVDLVRFKLESLGHRLESSENGQAALAALSVEAPDLILLDTMMPVLSGMQVLQSLKSAPDTAAIPVIMLTARRAPDDVVAALELGADDYITKPFLPDELVLRVQAALTKRRIALRA